MSDASSEPEAGADEDRSPAPDQGALTSEASMDSESGVEGASIGAESESPGESSSPAESEPESEPESPGEPDSDSDSDSPADSESDSPADSDSPAESEVPAGDSTLVSRASIPAPRLGRAPVRRGLDALTLLAMFAFVAVGGLLVFGFAQALVPAAEAQLDAACRPLNPKLLVGTAPELELEDLEGNAVSLSDFEGKFLVVNFWATWCEPCTREWPDLDQLSQRLAGRDDVAVIAIGIDEDRGALEPYLARMGLSETGVQVLWAKRKEAHRAFGSEKLPDTYFINRSGELRSVFVNIRAWGKARAVRCVESSIDRD